MRISYFFFFFNDTATTEIYTLSLHDALPISSGSPSRPRSSSTSRTCSRRRASCPRTRRTAPARGRRSEEHTSELQSQFHLVCRLLLEKKKKNNSKHFKRTRAHIGVPPQSLSH